MGVSIYFFFILPPPAQGQDDAVGGSIEIVWVINGILMGVELHALPAVLVSRCLRRRIATT